MKKIWGVSTALGMVGCAQVKGVPDGENSEVVWFGLVFAGSEFYLIGFGVLWKLESPFTLILLCVTFSFGKNNFVFMSLMLLKPVELLQ